MKLVSAKFALAASAGVAATSLVASAGLFLANSDVVGTAGRPGSKQNQGQTEKAIKQAFAALPLAFEANRGQTDGRVDFLARGPGYTAFLTSTEAVLKMTAPAKGQTSALRLQLEGSNPATKASGNGPLKGKVNYLKGAAGRWLSGLPTFSTVRYPNVYPGIDLVYYGNQAELEYDFVVKPGADPSRAKMRFDGADKLVLRPSGDLVATVGGHELIQRKPHIYQSTPGGRKVIPGRFKLDGRTVTFEVGAYDTTKTLIIDPTISYSSFVGGGGVDVGFGVTVDGSGNVYLTGSTSSVNFPTKGSVSCGTTTTTTTSLLCKNSMLDAYVTKIDTSAVGAASLVWSTYLGGDNDDVGFDVAVDSLGNAYVAGSTQSSDDAGTAAVEDAFPTTDNAYDTTCGSDGKCDAPPPDQTDGKCPPAGTGSCPTSPQPDAFVSKLNPTGSALLYSTFLGGSDFEQESNPAAGALGHMDIAVRGSAAYVASSTSSSDFPTTPTGDKTCGTLICNGQTDAFLSILDTAGSGGSSLVYSTYLGGDGADSAKGVALDAQGNAFVAGTTAGFNVNPVDSTSPVINNFPNTNLVEGYRGGVSDGFVAKLATEGLVAGASVKVKNLKTRVSATAGSVIYSTYLGGGGSDEIWDVAAQGADAYVTGFTDSGDNPDTPAPDGPAPYFPTTKDAYDTTFNGQATLPAGTNSFLNGDAFVTKLKADGAGAAYSTFLGGLHGDVGHGIAVDSTGAAYVTGYTMCKNQTPGSLVCDDPLYPYGSFPTVNPVQPLMGSKHLGMELHNSPTDGFVTKLNPAGSGLVYSTFLGGNNFDRGYAIALRQSLVGNEVYVTGRAGSLDFPTTTLTAFAPTKPSGSGNRDAYVTKISD